MRSPRAMALLLASVALPLAAAAPWVGTGGGPMRAYANTDPVPSVLEIAFQVELPVDLRGDAFHVHTPLILDGHVYVMAHDGVYRIPFATGEAEPLVTMEPDARPHSVVSDGRRLYVETQQGFGAYSLDGALLWEAPHPPLVGGDPRTFCVDPIVSGGTWFLFCEQSDQAVPGPARMTADAVFVAAVDADTGLERWRVELPNTAVLASGLPTATTSDPAPAFLTLVDGVLVAQWYEANAYDARTLTARRLDAFDAATGTRLWSKERPPPGVGLGASAPEAEFPMSGKFQGPFGVGASVVSLLDDLQRFDARSGELEWEVPFDEQTHGARFAAVSDGIVVAWAGTIWKIEKDGTTGETIAQLNDAQRMWNGLAATDDWVVGIAHDMQCGPNPAVEKTPDDCYDRWVAGTVEAASEDMPEGRPQWLHVYGPDDAHWTREFVAIDPDLAVAEGVIVVSEYPRRLTVYGRTGASIGLAASASDTYPAPGAVVTLDLGATTPGRFDPDVEYSVDWGDGTLDGPQRSPLFTHAYETPGDHAAIVTANNTAGQSSAERIVFHVGATPPQEPPFLARAFSAEYQERTFFLLGLAVTGIAGAVGVGQVHRRRRRLQRELVAIEEVYQMTRARPAECERSLAERRTRLRGMLVDGKLDENQFGVLDRRIEELARQARLDLVDEELGFLSVNMARTLRGILADGRVEKWERAHFVEAIDRDALLTPEQKTKVKALLDDWFARDGPRRADPP